MEQPVLSDKNQYPAKEIIYSHLGKSSSRWESLFDYIHKTHPDISEEWRYYNDGKSWLMKVTRKSKTIFWLSLVKNSFRTTFYFPVRVEKLITGSTISDELKEQFTKGKGSGKISGITIFYKNKKDVEFAKALIEIKLQIK